MLEEKAERILSLGYVCDRCLGRQFAELVPQLDNAEKGGIIRRFMLLEGHVRETEADVSNFGEKSHKKCCICGGVFSRIKAMEKTVLNKIENMDFRTFLVGVRTSDSLMMNEEKVFEKAGMKFSEPVKSEIKREITESIREKTGKGVDNKEPDILLLFDLNEMKTEIFPKSLYICGEYRKLKRGIAQLNSPRFRKTVQGIIEKPLLKKTLAKSSTLHALGREKKEARCLAWRPFVIEINRPKKRKFSLKGVQKEINNNNGVKVRKLRRSEKKEVAELKSKSHYKTYRLLVVFEKDVKGPETLKRLEGKVKQRTPGRLLGAIPEKTRNKKIKSIKWKRINNKKYQLEIKTESGLYIRELITGDSGRTKPSVSGLLGKKAELKEFDITEIEV